MTSPDYVDYFHALPEPTPLPRWRPSRRACSRASTRDLINDIYDLLYAQEHRRPGRHPADDQHRAHCRRLRPGDRRVHARAAARGAGTRLLAGHRGPGAGHRLPLRRPGVPRAGPRPDPLGRPRPLRRGPQLQHRPRRTGDLPAERRHAHAQHHSPDLGMGAYRNSWIIRELLGRELYPIEKTHRVPGVRGGRHDDFHPGRRPARRLRRCGRSTSPPTRRCCTLGHAPEGGVLDDAGLRPRAGRGGVPAHRGRTRTTTPFWVCGTAGRPSSPSVTTRPTSN